MNQDKESFETLPSKINGDEDQNQNSDRPDGEREEINDTDIRDQHDSTEDWDAENSRTGRHK